MDRKENHPIIKACPHVPQHVPTIPGRPRSRQVRLEGRQHHVSRPDQRVRINGRRRIEFSGFNLHKRHRACCGKF